MRDVWKLIGWLEDLLAELQPRTGEQGAEEPDQTAERAAEPDQATRLT